MRPVREEEVKKRTVSFFQRITGEYYVEPTTTMKCRSARDAIGDHFGSVYKKGLSSCTPTDLNCSVPKPDKYQDCDKRRCLLWPFTFCLERLFYGAPPIATFHCAQYRMEALENSTVGMIENSQHGSNSMLHTLSRHYWDEPGRC